MLIIVSALAWRFYVPAPSVEQGSNIPSQAPNVTSDTLSENSSHYARKDGFYTFLLLGSDDGHGNADSIMMVGFDTTTASVGVISIPRDSLVYREWSSFPKLNAAMGKGLDQLKAEVSYTLGIPIDFHIHIGIDAFIAVVDAMGGLDYYVPQSMYHDDEGGFIINLQEGQQHLDGHQTLELVRYRGYANADIGRTQTQQAVLKALATNLLSWNNFVNIENFIQIFQDHVDTNLSTSDLLWFGKQVFTAASNLNLFTQTLEGRGDGVYNDYRWCYELDKEKTLEIVNTYLSPYKAPRTAEDLLLVSAENYNS